MRKTKIQPVLDNSAKSFRSAEDALRLKYSQYNQQLLQQQQQQQSAKAAANSSRNSLSSEIEESQKSGSSSSPLKKQTIPRIPISLAANGNNPDTNTSLMMNETMKWTTTNTTQPALIQTEMTPTSTPHLQKQQQQPLQTQNSSIGTPTGVQKFFQKKGKNTEKKRSSFRISEQTMNDDDVQLNMKFQEETRRLSSILIKEGAAYTVDSNREQRMDKFGTTIDHLKKKHKIAFNEDITVYEVENWKKYNNRMYDEDDDKCACMILQLHFFFLMLCM